MLGDEYGASVPVHTARNGNGRRQLRTPIHLASKDEVDELRSTVREQAEMLRKFRAMMRDNQEPPYMRAGHMAGA